MKRQKQSFKNEFHKTGSISTGSWGLCDNEDTRTQTHRHQSRVIPPFHTKHTVIEEKTRFNFHARCGFAFKIAIDIFPDDLFIYFSFEYGPQSIRLSTLSSATATHRPSASLGLNNEHC